MSGNNRKNKILVHACCAPCSTYSFEKLVSEGIRPVGFFFNPNIYPETEYKKRRDEFIDFMNTKNYPFVLQETSYNFWRNEIKGFECEKEGGNRCELCFRFRLEKTAEFAKENDFDGFTTVLTISPHKNTGIINKIGKELEKKYKISFLEENFKKNDGFKKSLIASKEFNLYRQAYCGCEFGII